MIERRASTRVIIAAGGKSRRNRRAGNGRAFTAILIFRGEKEKIAAAVTYIDKKCTFRFKDLNDSS